MPEYKSTINYRALAVICHLEVRCVRDWREMKVCTTDFGGLAGVALTSIAFNGAKLAQI